MSNQKIKRKIKYSVLSIEKKEGEESIAEDSFSIIKQHITNQALLAVEIDEDPNKMLTLKLNQGKNSNFLIGELAYVKKNDLPAAMKISSLEVRELKLDADEGIYLPMHFILEKKGRYAAIASEFYVIGPQITSIAQFFNTLYKKSSYNFRLHYLVDRESYRNLKQFNRITALEVRLATKNWPSILKEENALKGLDKYIKEINTKFGDINVTIRFSARRSKSLDKVKESLDDLMSFFKNGYAQKVIKRAKIEGKDALENDTFIDMLYDKVVVTEDVEIDQTGGRRVNKDSMYEKLYIALAENTEFINRTMPREETEED